jgi:hypothetical protein
MEDLIWQYSVLFARLCQLTIVTSPIHRLHFQKYTKDNLNLKKHTFTLSSFWFHTKQKGGLGIDSVSLEKQIQKIYDSTSSIGSFMLQRLL